MNPEGQRLLNDPTDPTDQGKKEAIRSVRSLGRYRFCPSFYHSRQQRDELITKYGLMNTSDTSDTSDTTISQILTPVVSDPLIILVLSSIFIAILLLSSQLFWIPSTIKNSYFNNLTADNIRDVGCHLYGSYRSMCLPCNQEVVEYLYNFFVILDDHEPCRAIRSTHGCGDVAPILCSSIEQSGIDAVAWATSDHVLSYVDPSSDVNGIYVTYILFPSTTPHWASTSHWEAFQCNRTIQGVIAGENAFHYTIWAITAGLVLYLLIIIGVNVIIRRSNSQSS